ncbi:patatin-like phospholipase [Oleiphilus messinensis]|uniref:Patatin-like phospholipase n=2 Tax=Oleiphilus messinensis TaxID=141451 RepID=A0A1Y0I852_9GAMM|nr:patatin-like phospholipase [Oleiphilus messinensis]
MVDTPMTNLSTGPKTVSKRKRAIVIGCGGIAGGAWTTAMLHAYEKASGVDARTADFLVGTSAGAVMVALLGAGISVSQLVAAQQKDEITLDALHWVHKTALGGAFPPLPASRLTAPRLMWAWVQGKVPLMTGLSGMLPRGRQDLSALYELIETVNEQQAWLKHENTWIMTVDMKTGERVAFGRKKMEGVRLSSAVCASYAVPGWCPPVTINGREYFDGGAFSPTSADLLAQEDVDEVVVIPPMITHSRTIGLNIALRTERILRNAMTKRVDFELEMLEKAGKQVVLLEPSEADLEAFGVNMMDPARRKKVFETAMQSCPTIVEQAGVGAFAG